MKVNMGLEAKIEHQAAQSEELISIALVSEGLRKNFSEQLRYSKSKLEEIENQNFNHEVREKISDHSIDYL